jgi:hypothetical protein
VSFVSVTQQFNTTTSMGRLTLNVLLSFAQFEREVTSERIRDKIAASKRKGLWVGGKVPLGYMAKDRKITVVEEEAERVRTIFRSYLELGSLDRVMGDLHRRGIVTKIQVLKTGRTIGGIAFTRGPLSYVLRNRFYIGEVVYKGEILRGEQPAIIDRDLFELVQARLAEQQNNHNRLRANSEALLMGRIFDDAGHLMSPSHARKRGVRYRYYVSLPLIQGQSERTGSICRIPAIEVERVIADAVRRELKAGPDIGNDILVKTHVSRVEVQRDQLVVTLDPTPAEQSDEPDAGAKIICIPWQKPPSKRRREILLPESFAPDDPRPIRADARARLVTAIARARCWLNELTTGAVPSIEAIAARERCSVRKVAMTISLAFLAPDLVRAAIEGRLPRGIGIARLCDLPPEWSRQHQVLGLAAH